MPSTEVRFSALRGRRRTTLGLGNDGPALRGQREAVRERRDAELQRRPGLAEFLEARRRRGLQPVFGEIARHGLAPPGRLGGEEDLQVRPLDEALQRRERILRPPVDGERRKRLGAEPRLVRGLALLEVDARMLAQAQVELLGRHEKLRRREERPVGIAARHLVPRRRVAPELVDRRGDVAVQRDGAALGQVIEEGRHRLEEERQVVLDPRRRHAVRDVAIERLLRRVALEELAPAAAKARAPIVVQRELARRQHADLVHRVERALRIDVEGLERVDDLVVQVDAVGERAAHREQVDQAATHADFSRRDDLRHVLVAGGRELAAQILHGKALADLQLESAPGDVGGRAEPHQRRRRRDDGEVEVGALDAIERRQPLGDEILVRRKLVVRQRLPVGQQAGPQPGREPVDLLEQALRVLRGRGDDGERSFGRGEAGERERVGRAGEAGEAALRGERVSMHQRKKRVIISC
jgi:hypothetical protein